MSMTDGETLFSLPPEYLYLGTAKWFGVLAPIWHPLCRIRAPPPLPRAGTRPGCSLAGLARSSPAKGQNMIFYVLASVIIGGVSLNGGRGRVIGALTGGILLGLLLLALSRIAAF
jgi:simple sugar transport system permease protein